MDFAEGYVYHIKDEYFKTVNDDKLMQNKENGNYRPTFFCMRDEGEPALFWVVPMSTRIEKYQAVQQKQIVRYGECITIVIGEYDNRQSAFLLQNMFPITQNYLDHIHTRNGNPVPVNHTIQQSVKSKIKKIRKLLEKGRKVVFPDIRRLENIMLDEIKHSKAAVTAKQISQPKSIHDRIEAAKTDIAQRAAEQPTAVRPTRGTKPRR